MRGVITGGLSTLPGSGSARAADGRGSTPRSRASLNSRNAPSCSMVPSRGSRLTLDAGTRWNGAYSTVTAGSLLFFSGKGRPSMTALNSGTSASLLTRTYPVEYRTVFALDLP
eukprot:CAMPEP_0206141814 /NCGR_PEP_ID=MMETSP1473-20131121/14251_1 /ASSEMBLY_ACC=CAM_ASM_001109 /TAXON_ID=1461547 /ORGANISM="Stichococcus sp, Strain RCC1054" /LENGTH=112 /DNA_ID=CAMNT_0053536529 /DNA_START=21 /DNA_END=359 /DNA_ORIENTATION=+